MLVPRVTSVLAALVAALVAAFVLLATPVAHAQVLSISDVTQTETDIGTTIFSFIVSLDTPAPSGGVTFDIATAPNTATAGTDYVHTSLTGQAIPVGSTTYNFDAGDSEDGHRAPGRRLSVTSSGAPRLRRRRATATGETRSACV